MAALNKGERWAINALAVASLLIMVGGLLVVWFQAMLWLRDGFWPPLEFRLLRQAIGGPEPALQWQGLQKIAVWLLAMPLSLGVVCIVLALGLLAEQWQSEPQRQPVR